MVEWIPGWLAKRYAEMYVVKKEFSLKDAVETWGVKHSTARKVLSELARSGWIKEVTKGRERRYMLAGPEEVVFKFATGVEPAVLDEALKISRKHRDVLFFGSLVTLRYGHGRVEDYLVVLTRLREEHILERGRWAVPVEVLGLGDTKMSKKAAFLLHRGRRLKIPSREDSIALFAYCIFHRGLALRISDYVSLFVEPGIDWECLLERAERFGVEKAIYLTLKSEFELQRQSQISGDVLKKLEEMAHGKPEPLYWDPVVSKREIRDAYKKVGELW